MIRTLRSDSMSSQIAGYQIRAYRDGDENELVLLFNNVYSEYAGFVPRTVEYWLWCCKSRPGVREEGIFVVDSGGKIIAYAVVADSGEILEFCRDPDNAEKEVVLKLLETAERHVENLGASSIRLNAPKDNEIIREACLDLGYAESSLPFALQVSIVDFPGLIKGILLSKLKSAKADIHGEILLKVKQAYQRDHECVVLKISDGELYVGKSETCRPNFTIEADKRTFASCIFGGMSPKAAIFTGKIKVYPFWKALDSIALLTLLRLDDNWYVPLSDYG